MLSEHLSLISFISTTVLFIAPILYIIFIILKKQSSSSQPSDCPKSYPLVGSSFAFLANYNRRVQWLSEILQNSPSATFVLHRMLGYKQIFTANPANVQHILKTNFVNYVKGENFRLTVKDFLGDGIFNADGANWKFQRQVSSHEFNTKSLRKFVENVVDTELNKRLVPILESYAESQQIIDLQDILQRFAFDNICKIAFGYDPAYLLPSLPQAKFPVAFEFCVKVISERFNSVLPISWKIKRFLGIGSEKKLKLAISEIRNFAKAIVKEKKQELSGTTLESTDLLSRFLSSGHSNEDFVTDIVLSFILAGRDTTSAALTWFFWLLSNHSEVEAQILNEIREKSDGPIYDEVKDMVYTHAALCESMRLYPPVPVDTKSALNDDILPSGHHVKKGMRVAYHPYAMGRMAELWGPDWPEFKPERWLQAGADSDKWSFVGRDAYIYTVFQAGPRICLGKEMAFLQMKRVVSGVLRRFKVVPKDGIEPVFVSDLTAKMQGGFPVRFITRDM